MDNRELEKENEIKDSAFEEVTPAETATEAENTETDTAASEDTAAEAYEAIEDKPKKPKKEKKPKEKKAKDGAEKGSKKAIIICIIAAAIVVAIGVTAACVLWYIGSKADEDIVPGEEQDMPELENGTKFY